MCLFGSEMRNANRWAECCVFAVLVCAIIRGLDGWACAEFLLFMHFTLESSHSTAFKSISLTHSAHKHQKTNVLLFRHSHTRTLLYSGKKRCASVALAQSSSLNSWFSSTFLRSTPVPPCASCCIDGWKSASSLTSAHALSWTPA